MNEPTQEPEPTFEVLPPQPLPPPVKLRHAHTLANLWHIFINLRGDLAPGTRRKWEVIARRFCKFFRKRKLNTEGVVEWMSYLQTYKTPTRIPRNLNARHINDFNHRVRPFLLWMRKMNYVQEDLASCLTQIVEQPKPKSQIITEDEYERIKQYCTGKEHHQAHLWLCILAYRTGMSLVDCCHLRWRDVHLNDDGPSYIDIYRIKTQRLGAKSLCQIPVVPNSDLHQWLLHLKTVPRYKRFDGIDDYVHQDADGLYKCTFARIHMDFKRIFLYAAVGEGKTFKHFRNALCSNLVNSGMPLPLICKVTGHQNVQTLLAYLKPDRSVLQDGMIKAQQYSSATITTETAPTTGIVGKDDEPEEEDEEEDEEEEEEEDKD